MAIARVTTWSLGNILTATALNDEFDAVFSKVGDITGTATVSGVWTFTGNPVFNTGGVAWSAVSKTGSILDDIADVTITSASAGHVLYRNAGNTAWVNAAPGATSAVQAYDAFLVSLAALGTAADKGIYTTAVDTAAEFTLTAAGRAILDDAAASDQRTTLGLGTIATQAASAVAITGGTVTGITDLAVADGGTGSSTAADARTALGLGSIATQAASAVAITGGTVTGITDLAIADGGTGASTASTAFDALKQAATETATGVVELATTAEINTGTDAGRVMCPDQFAASNRGTRVVYLKVIAEATVLTTGDGKMYFTVPAELGGMDLVDCEAHVYTVSSSGTPTVQIHNLTQAADMLSTRITIDVSENDSLTAAAAPVIDTANDDVASGDVLRVDVDTAGTSTAGLDVRLSFRTP